MTADDRPRMTPLMGEGRGVGRSRAFSNGIHSRFSNSPLLSRSPCRSWPLARKNRRKPGVLTLKYTAELRVVFHHRSLRSDVSIAKKRSFMNFFEFPTGSSLWVDRLFEKLERYLGWGWPQRSGLLSWYPLYYHYLRCLICIASCKEKNGITKTWEASLEQFPLAVW